MSHDLPPGKIDLFIAALCIGFYSWMALSSKGFVEPDEMSHFMKSMDARNSWHFMLDIWGRPFCIIYYAIGAGWGINFTRLLSVLASALTALGTVKLARIFLPAFSNPSRHYRSAIWLLLFAQPYFMLQSFSVMTEILLACFWVWAAVAVSQKRWRFAGLCIGLSGLARPEGTIATASWIFFLVFFRDRFELKNSKLILSVAFAWLPSLLWWLTGMYVFGGWDWFIRHWPWAVESVYGKTPAEAVLAVLNATNFWILVPASFGIYFLLRKISTQFELRKQSVILLIIPCVCIFTLHFLLGVLGLFGSLSLPRYYVTVAPFIAVITWIGLESVRHSFRHTKIFLFILIAVLLLIPSRALYMMHRGELPFPKNCDQIKLEQMMLWFERNRNNTDFNMDPRAENIIAAHPYVSYISTASSNTPGSLRLFARDGIRLAPAGTVIVYEKGVWMKNGFPTVDSLIRWNYQAVEDRTLNERLAEACDHDPLEEDMKFYIKQ